MYSQRGYAAGVATALQSLGLGHVTDELAKDGIHHLSNILTLTADVHALFDNLRVWLEAIPGETNVVKYSLL
jgi:hypothetical protein